MTEDHDYTIGCPHCGEDIYDDVDQCPHCRQYVSASDYKKQMPTWLTVVVILTIIALLVPMLASFLR